MISALQFYEDSLQSLDAEELGIQARSQDILHFALS